MTGSKKFTVVGGAFFLTCDPPTRRVTVKKTVSYDRKKRGWGWGVSRVVGDSSGESVGWSDSGLFAAVPGNNTRKWVGPKTKQTYGSKKRGGCRGGEPRKLLLSMESLARRMPYARLNTAAARLGNVPQPQ